MKLLTGCLVFAALLQSASAAQQASPGPQTAEQRREEIRVLRAELESLSSRLSSLEATESAASAPSASVSTSATAQTTPTDLPVQDEAVLSFLRGTTLNFGVDGYYGYNFNHPAGRVNLLRAYDVSSNSFNLNQATVMVEHLPAARHGERLGARVDLQFGQATETLQGSSANELRPQIWRNLFQAYGSYLAPVGSGLQVDFGKWSSALGVEGNYTKDQINYSRSYLFDFLPFYHMGFRANYNISPAINLAYWLVNGAQQTEDFNGFKSQAFLAVLKPAKAVSWNVNYYFGQEQRDIPSDLAGRPSGASPAPNGREHIFDSYATWTASPRLTVVGEADYVLNRVQQESRPTHVSAGAAYLRYTLPHGWVLGTRAEYLSDRGGLFSGRTQALKEMTFNVERQLEPGLLVRMEYRRDFSNQRYFLTERKEVLDKAQSTATLGLIYWWGMKQGNW